jgi:chromosome segregation ATPase
MRHTFSEHQALGDAIVERTSSLDATTKKALKTPLVAFLDAHKELTKAQSEADDARETRDDALKAVAEADESLDGKLEALADAVVGAGLGKRKNPFEEFSKLSPSELTSIGYAREVEEARSIAKKIRKAKDAPKSLESFVKAVDKAADAVEKALSALTKPQARYAKSLAARDELLLDWQQKLSRLKKIATGALVDDPATFATLFDAPAAVATAKKQKPRKKPAAKPAATPS